MGMSTTIDGSNSVTINSGAILGITSGTAVASTSGTSIDFTGIPSWVKRITVMFNGVSLSGTSQLQIQLGAGSVTTTGYTANSTSLGASSMSTTNATSGFILFSATPSYTNSGHMFLTLLSSNTWISSSSYKNTANISCIGAGDVTLSGTLDRVRIASVNGTDTFDAGSINILYE
jgi:hypothetical protein